MWKSAITMGSFLFFAVFMVGWAVHPGDARADGSAPPPPPIGVNLTTTGRPMELTAVWLAVSDVTSYAVRWRLHGEDFPLENEIIVKDATATFAVAQQGLWVVRIESCNAMGCGRGINATATVIINTH